MKGILTTFSDRARKKAAELAARYLEEHVDVRCKESTRKMYLSVVERFIVPSYGDEAVERDLQKDRDTALRCRPH